MLVKLEHQLLFLYKMLNHKINSKLLLSQIKFYMLGKVVRLKNKLFFRHTGTG